MNNVKIIEIDKSKNRLIFDNGMILQSYHVTECCEEHYLSVNDLELSELEDLRFDLSTDDFFNRIEGYGIELLPTNGHPVRIPGYGENNGCYSSDITLIISDAINIIKRYDITECQVITY